MKSIVTFLFFLTVSLGFSQDKIEVLKTQVVEASCGQCKFGMTSKKGCDLAVRIDGESYFVEGTKLDDHGDAHAQDGFCSAIRMAEVSGEIVNEKYVATFFKLLPQKQSK
jgi:hypothetical protein